MPFFCHCKLEIAKEPSLSEFGIQRRLRFGGKKKKKTKKEKFLIFFQILGEFSLHKDDKMVDICSAIDRVVCEFYSAFVIWVLHF